MASGVKPYSEISINCQIKPTQFNITCLFSDFAPAHSDK